MKDTRTADYPALAEWLIDFARSQGADEMEVSIQDGTEFSLDVRLGEIENLTEAGSRSLSFRVIKDLKTAYSSSSDLEEGPLRRLVINGLTRAELSSRDEHAGLPAPFTRTKEPDELGLFDPRVQEMDSQEKIRMALETERIALLDKRITNSHGASLETRVVQTTLVNSHGFSGQYRETLLSLGVALQAGETDNRVEGSWGSTRRHLDEVESEEAVARRAVERTVRQLNPRKIRTQNVPVLFEPRMTGWLMGFLFSCVSGSSVYRKTTFLADRLGDRIADKKISVRDDGRLEGKLGTVPFDSEGVPTLNKAVIDRGVLKTFLCNTYSARKLGKETTGNADGAGVGPTNFYLEAGEHAPEDIIRSMERGLILTRTIGHGLNPVTGDISRGAFGLWVESGEVIYPVSEVTISGNLGRILNEIEKIGTDLEFNSSLCGPTVLIGEMTVAGQPD